VPGHGDVPAWVAWSSVFSVTICALPRGANNLCFDPVGSAILNAARHYDSLEKWDVRLLLMMPDHRVAGSNATDCSADYESLTQSRPLRTVRACTLLARF
jgi:hypothetical protein